MLTREDGRYAVWRLPLGHGYDVLIRSVGFAPLRRSVAIPAAVPSDGSLPDPVVDAVLLPIDRPLSPGPTAMRAP